MRSTNQRVVELRQEIGMLKVALQVTNDSAAWRQIYTRLNACFKETIALAEHRLQTPLRAQLQERSVGDK
jgi:hypothetical protein